MINLPPIFLHNNGSHSFLNIIQANPKVYQEYYWSLLHNTQMEFVYWAGLLTNDQYSEFLSWPEEERTFLKIEENFNDELIFSKENPIQEDYNKFYTNGIAGGLNSQEELKYGHFSKKIASDYLNPLTNNTFKDLQKNYFPYRMIEFSSTESNSFVDSQSQWVEHFLEYQINDFKRTQGNSIFLDFDIVLVSDRWKSPESWEVVVPEIDIAFNISLNNPSDSRCTFMFPNEDSIPGSQRLDINNRVLSFSLDFNDCNFDVSSQASSIFFNWWASPVDKSLVKIPEEYIHKEFVFQFDFTDQLLFLDTSNEDIFSSNTYLLKNGYYNNSELDEGNSHYERFKFHTIEENDQIFDEKYGIGYFNDYLGMLNLRPKNKVWTLQGNGAYDLENPIHFAISGYKDDLELKQRIALISHEDYYYDNYEGKLKKGLNSKFDVKNKEKITHLIPNTEAYLSLDFASPITTNILLRLAQNEFETVSGGKNSIFTLKKLEKETKNNIGTLLVNYRISLKEIEELSNESWEVMYKYER